MKIKQKTTQKAVKSGAISRVGILIFLELLLLTLILSSCQKQEDEEMKKIKTVIVKGSSAIFMGGQTTAFEADFIINRIQPITILSVAMHVCNENFDPEIGNNKEVSGSLLIPKLSSLPEYQNNVLGLGNSEMALVNGQQIDCFIDISPNLTMSFRSDVYYDNPAISPITILYDLIINYEIKM